MLHHTSMPCLPASTRRLILSVTRSCGSAAKLIEPEHHRHARILYPPVTANLMANRTASTITAGEASAILPAIILATA